MQQLGYTDAIFINLETTNTPQQIGFMGIYDPSTAKDGSVRFKDVLENFGQRLHSLPTFRTRLVEVPGRLDRPYWVEDDSFDVEYHIRHLALPQPGDWRQLCIQIARMHARPLDLKRPLWECNVIEGLHNIPGCPPGAFAVYIKVHHSMVDGDLGQRVLAVLHDLEPYPAPEAEDKEEEARIAEKYKMPRMGGAEMVAKAFTNKAKNALPYAKKATEVISELVDTVTKIAKDELPTPAQGPKTRFDEPVSRHRTFEAAEFSVAEMKAINKATSSEKTGKTTINDICVTICSGALRKYLEFHGELPDVSLVGNLPVNMRKRGTVSDENNVVASMMTLIHTDIADPIERLFAVHQEIGEAKKLIGTPLSHPFKIGGLLPPFMIKPISRLYSEGGLTRFLPAGTPAVITNVPGPRMDLYSNGAKLVKMYLLGMLTPGVGLFHAIFSLGDMLTIAVVADRDQMPDPAFYRECLEESYAELKAAVLDKPKPKTKARTKAKTKA
jgi:diacylglycerol O-acyltransferase